MNMFADIFLQIDKSLINRETLQCKKFRTTNGNFLKRDVASLPITLQEVLIECVALMLDKKMKLDLMQEKSERLNHNQNHNIKK